MKQRRLLGRYFEICAARVAVAPIRHTEGTPQETLVVAKVRRESDGKAITEHAEQSVEDARQQNGRCSSAARCPASGRRPQASSR